MKMKTMLKFLICLFIICEFSMPDSMAAIQHQPVEAVGGDATYTVYYFSESDIEVRCGTVDTKNGNKCTNCGALAEQENGKWYHFTYLNGKRCEGENGKGFLCSSINYGNWCRGCGSATYGDVALIDGLWQHAKTYKLNDYGYLVECGWITTVDGILCCNNIDSCSNGYGKAPVEYNGSKYIHASRTSSSTGSDGSTDDSSDVSSIYEINDVVSIENNNKIYQAHRDANFAKGMAVIMPEVYKYCTTCGSRKPYEEGGVAGAWPKDENWELIHLKQCVPTGQERLKNAIVCDICGEIVHKVDGKYVHLNNTGIVNAGIICYLYDINNNKNDIICGYVVAGRCSCGMEVKQDRNGKYYHPIYINNRLHAYLSTTNGCTNRNNGQCTKKVEVSCNKYIHIESAETPLTVEGGPSAQSFFQAGVNMGDRVMNDKIIHDNTSPLLHIQSLIMYFGVVAGVIVVLIYAIQWMSAAPAKRQELKTGLWSLIIGVTLLVLGPRLGVSIYELLIKNADTEMVQHSSYIANIVITVIKLIGYITATIMMLVVGIQWIISPPAKRQELKGRMVNIIIGAVLLVGGVALLGIIYDFANDSKEAANDFLSYEESQIYKS